MVISEFFIGTAARFLREGVRDHVRGQGPPQGRDYGHGQGRRPGAAVVMGAAATAGAKTVLNPGATQHAGPCCVAASLRAFPVSYNAYSTPQNFYDHTRREI